MKVNQILKIINDHGPKPLQYQFMAEFTNQFERQAIKDEPINWVISFKEIA